MEEKPSYYAIIPANVRYDKELKANEKLLYSEITTLSNKTGLCYATNKYFAELYGVEVETISRWIKHLKNLGYIDIEICYKNDTKEIEKRVIKLMCGQVNQKINNLLTKKSIPYCSKNQGGIDQKVKENNTSIIITPIVPLKSSKSNFENNNFFEDEKLNSIFLDFLELRNKLKAVNSERAIKMLLNKLSKYDNDTKYKMIENSIINSWKDVYEIKKPKSLLNINFSKKRF